MKKTFFATAVSLFWLQPVAAVYAHQDIHDAATRYRHQAMKAAKAHRAAAVDAVKAGAPFDGQVVEHARALKAFFTALPGTFPKKGNYKESDASPEIWKQWEEFERRSKEAGVMTVELKNAAERGEWGAVDNRLRAIGKACKGCHDEFRE